MIKHEFHEVDEVSNCFPSGCFVSFVNFVFNFDFSNDCMFTLLVNWSLS